MSSGRWHPVGEAQLRYRRADGEFAETTLERVVVDDLVAGLPVREFRWYRGQTSLFRLVLVVNDGRAGGL
jgi:hypothetical protein